MSVLIPLALFGVIPLALVLFAFLGPRRGLVTFFVVAWLFLPVAGFNFPFLPLYDKRFAASVAALLAILALDPGGLRRARFSWVDAPMVVMCVTPFLSSLSNGLGTYDGLSSAFRQVVLWGLPYWYGRCYMRDLAALRYLALGIVTGGMVYIAFCLWEIRMSPRLHLIVYGLRQHGWSQVHRFGGYRPMVFMDHGLMLSFWMATSALTALWLSVGRSVHRLGPLPMLPCAIALVVTTVLCKSVGAIALLIGGVGVLVLSSLTRTRVLLVLLAFVPPAYCVGRMTGWVSGDRFVDLVSQATVERSASVRFRLDSENVLMERALQRPLLGWGRFGRSNPGDPDTGRYLAVQDGLWIGTLGASGLVGLTALMLVGLVPLMLGLRALGPTWGRSPPLAPLAALLIVLTLYTIDNLMNAMISPIYMIVAGGITTTSVRRLAAANRGQGAHHGPLGPLGVRLGRIGKPE